MFQVLDSLNYLSTMIFVIILFNYISVRINFEQKKMRLHIYSEKIIRVFGV